MAIKQSVENRYFVAFKGKVEDPIGLIRAERSKKGLRYFWYAPGLKEITPKEIDEMILCPVSLLISGIYMIRNQVEMAMLQ